MDESGKKNNRRDFLFTASYTVGAVGLGATVWPFIDQMNPDSSVKALAKIEVDLSQIELGKSITVLWRGKPVFIRKRTKEEINEGRIRKGPAPVNMEIPKYEFVDNNTIKIG